MLLCRSRFCNAVFRRISPFSSPVRFAGHSKWKTIKGKKDIADRKKMILFTRVASIIANASRACKGDMAESDLISAIQQGKDVGMPRESIMTAVERGKSGGLRGSEFEELLYEGYGPGSVAVIIQAMTDKRARTAQLIKGVFTDNFCETASVFWMFDKQGIFRLSFNPKTTTLSDAKNNLLELLIDHEVEDIDDGEEPESIIVSVKPNSFSVVLDKLKTFKPDQISVVSADFEYIANTPLEISDEDMSQFENFQDEMYGVEEVVNIFHNIA